MDTTQTSICSVLAAIQSGMSLEQAASTELRAYIYLSLALFDGVYFNRARELFVQTENHLMVQEVDRLLCRYTKSVPDSSGRRDVEQRFWDYAHTHNLVVLRTLQTSRDDDELRAAVFLVFDTDEKVKVLKELIPSTEVCDVGVVDFESTVFEQLGSHPAVTQYYGSVKIDETLAFLRREYAFGQSLLDFMRDGRRVTQDVAVQIVRDLARILADVHDQGIVYLDLRPKNVLIHMNDVQMFDFNTSRRVASRDEEIDTHVFDPRYAPPEMVLRHCASTASDVFQLGVLLHQLLTGTHPFDVCHEFVEHSDDWQNLTLKFALASALVPYVYTGNDSHLALVARMLHPDPSRRPRMREVAQYLTERHPHQVVIPHPERYGISPVRERNTVLFPARMGIPHKGHIDYIARLIELGYFVRVSLQQAYTQTSRDPIPKWLVQKMIARSLRDLGYTQNDFSIELTPFFETDEEHRMHFAASPGWKDVVVIASSNPDVHTLFAGYPILDQSAVFGKENVMYLDRSWGAQLRAAIRSNDRKTFEQFAASGIESIRSFNELRAMLADESCPIEFVHGCVFVEVQKEHELFLRKRVRRFQTPEQAIMNVLRTTDPTARFVDVFARDTQISLQDQPMRLVYHSVQFDGTDEVIRYDLLPLM